MQLSSTLLLRPCVHLRHQSVEHDVEDSSAGVSGDLIRVSSDEAGSCSFVGQITPSGGGRWFTYVEFNHDDETVEAWLPVEAGSDGTVTLARELYRPVGGGDSVDAAQVVYGVLIYLAGFALLALGLSAARSPHKQRGAARGRRQPALSGLAKRHDDKRNAEAP